VASIRTRPRKDGTTYAVLYTIEGRQSSMPFDDVKAAEAFKAAVEVHGAARALEMHGIDPGRRRQDTKHRGMTVAKWLEHYIDHLTGVEQKTIDDYRRYAHADIGPVLGDIPLAALTQEDVARWVTHMEITPSAKTGRPVSAKTIKNRHGFLSGALAAAVPKHIGANPAAGRRLPRGEGEDADDEMRMLSHDEFALLLASVTQPWKPLVEFLVASGCRWGEASALKPADVDHGAGTVKIRRAWKLSSKGYRIGPPKTKRSRRTIDVDPSVLGKLDYGGEWLFTNPGRGRRAVGGPVRYSNFRRNVWDPAVERAGIDPKPTPHDLRHTCASWMLNGGVELFVVSRHLGHENIATTADIYGDIDRTSTKAAAAVVASALKTR